MIQADVIVKGLALIGVFSVLRCAAILVLRMDGHDVKSHRHIWLTAAAAVAALVVGWAYENFEANPPTTHPFAERTVSHIGPARTTEPARDSFLMSDEPMVLDVETEPIVYEFDPESIAVESIKHVFQPYAHLILSSEQDDVALPTPEPDEDNLIPNSERANLQSLDSNGSMSMLWGGAVSSIAFEQEPPHQFGQADSETTGNVFSFAEDAIGPQQYSIYRNLELLTQSNGAVQRDAVKEEKTWDPGISDIPGAPSQQIEGLMRAAPGFYETIPEVRQFLDR
ncbi:MAG: hypothetical protein KDN22_05030 [Verrucomicrobiae bacterium]|nr:hypothetical protein [Verrucomicrobiae bacterium]